MTFSTATKLEAVSKDCDKKTNPAQRLADAFSEKINAVNELINKRLDSPIGIIPKIGKYIINSGGKRIRPLLAIACSEMCGYKNGDNHIKLATAIEFMHTATLLHDDVIDQSEKRRGKKCAHLVWGNKPAILVGDFLFSKSFELMAEQSNIEATKLISKTSSQITSGEIMQLLNIDNVEMSIETYNQIIHSKTAHLFLSSCKLGGILAGSPESITNALAVYGENIGMAYQIVDDILDYDKDNTEINKNIGDDFYEGKTTLPIILLYKKSTDTEKDLIKNIFCKDKRSSEELEYILSLISKYEILKESIKYAIYYKDKAVEALELIQDNPTKGILLDLCESTISRKY